MKRGSGYKWKVIDLSAFTVVLVGLLFSGSIWALVWALFIAAVMVHNWRKDDEL